MNSHNEPDNEINSSDIENTHQRDTFLHVKDETCESPNNVESVMNSGAFDETNKLFKNFNTIKTYNSDDDNNSNLSSFINSQTRIKV